jgi:Ser/Thr protein kinase RdoA (MazF antagonist)
MSLPEGVFEVYPWVDGVAHHPSIQDAARRPAAIELAQLHRLASSYLVKCEPMLPQFRHYPAPIPEASRFDNPGVLLQAVRFVSDNFASPHTRADTRRACETVQEWAEKFAPIHARLPLSIIHGDYNACNLLFTPPGGVQGVFDFDWAWRDSRVRDVAQGAFFFGARRSQALSGGDIWSLTSCPTLGLPQMMDFVAAYQSVYPLSQEEREALPHALLGCWIAWRTEGVMKVAEERRAEFMLADFFTPFQWVRKNRSSWLRGLASHAK